MPKGIGYGKGKKGKGKKGKGSTVSITKKGKRTVIITDDKNIDPAYLKKNKAYQKKKKAAKRKGKGE